MFATNIDLVSGDIRILVQFLVFQIRIINTLLACIVMHASQN